MELVDIYDDEQHKTGRVIARDETPRPGEHLLIVHLCLFNSRGEMLIQQRSFEKDRYPGCWDLSAGGFADSGESAEGALIREVREELGLQLNPADLKFMLCEPFSYVYDYIYFARRDINPEKLTLQSEELAGAKFASEDEILRMSAEGKFVDYEEQLLRRIFNFERGERMEMQA